MARRIYLSLGSNLGDRLGHLRAGVEGLRPGMAVESVSSVYETEPQGVVTQPPFFNLALSANTELSPREVLILAKGVETAVGRRPTYRWGPRILDIDLILYDDEVVEQPDLLVPHPRMAERAFVLIPLAEIAPDVRHPLLKITMRELAHLAPDHESVRAIAP